jgi:hypothetical protein
MRIDRRALAAAVLLGAQSVSGCVESPGVETTAAAPNASAVEAEPAPLMTVNQVMHAILFPLGNAVFLAQTEDPEALPRDPQPSASPNPLTGLYGGWQAVENSALALAETADLLLVEGRSCSNGQIVDVEAADWIRFVGDYREKSVAAYEAALTKDQDAMIVASGDLYETCVQCHRAYRREPTPGDPKERCIPRSSAATR